MADSERYYYFLLGYTAANIISTIFLMLFFWGMGCGTLNQLLLDTTTIEAKLRQRAKKRAFVPKSRDQLMKNLQKVRTTNSPRGKEAKLCAQVLGASILSWPFPALPETDGYDYPPDEGMHSPPVL